MKRRSHAKRRDLNEPEIVAALKASGCSVMPLDKFDLLVGRNGVDVKMEVKNRDGKNRRTESQIDIDNNWRGSPLYYVRSVDEAIDVMNSATREAGRE